MLSHLLIKTLPTRSALNPQKFPLAVLTNYTYDDLTSNNITSWSSQVGMNFRVRIHLTYCCGLTSDVVCHIQYANIFSIHLGNMLMFLDPGWTRAQRWWLRICILTHTSWQKTCVCHLQVTKGPRSNSQQARTKMIPESLGFCPFKVQASILAFLSLLRKQAMLWGPFPPSFSPYNWVQCVLNREEASVRYEMKQICRQTAKEAAGFLICRYHFRDCGESFTSWYWETKALEREPEVAGRNTQLSPRSTAIS